VFNHFITSLGTACSKCVLKFNNILFLLHTHTQLQSTV
jgi:hypothetical protein